MQSPPTPFQPLRTTSVERQTPHLEGWVPQPNARGTMDIVYSCASTIFVCVWVMLHLNVPAKHDSAWTRLLRKLRWFVLALLAPELLMLFAGGQWASAKRSVDDMKALGIEGWTSVHAFYADSGGFLLHAPDSKPFPVTARQIHYLVKHRYAQIPEITQEEIWDKSKADPFAKAVAALQSAWFVLQVIARGVEALPVTLLELSTIAIMTCTGATLFFWFHKPLDAGTPTSLKSELSVADILVEAGNAARKPYRYTPLDFAEPLAYTSSELPMSHLWGVQERPLPRIPNDRDSLLHNWKVVLIISVPTAAFGTFQLIAWNFVFPTRTEQLLWRYTCLGNGIILGLGCALEAGAIIASKYTVAGLHTFKDYKLRWPYKLLFFIPGILYFCARTIVILEVIISLRALPSGCFVKVGWTSFLPHI